MKKPASKRKTGGAARNGTPPPRTGTVTLFVATRKGAFLLRSDRARRQWKLTGPIMLGQQINHILRVVVHRRRPAIRIGGPAESAQVRRNQTPAPWDAADLRLPHVRAQRKSVQQNDGAEFGSAGD